MNQVTKKRNFWEFVKKMSGKQKLVSLGLVVLLSIGALGAMGEFSSEKNGIISNLAETVGLKKRTSTQLPPTPTNTPQLSKEYIYAGSRMLAVEDYGIAPNNPQAKNEQNNENRTTAQQNVPKSGTEAKQSQKVTKEGK